MFNNMHQWTAETSWGLLKPVISPNHIVPVTACCWANAASRGCLLAGEGVSSPSKLPLYSALHSLTTSAVLHIHLPISLNMKSYFLLLDYFLSVKQKTCSCESWMWALGSGGLALTRAEPHSFCFIGAETTEIYLGFIFYFLCKSKWSHQLCHYL